MKVTLYRPDPPDPDAPWMLTPPDGQPVFIFPPPHVIERIESQNGEVEAELDNDGEWRFPGV